MNVYELPIEELEPDPKNANKGTERGRAMLGASVHDTKLHRGVAVDRNNRLIAGNKTAAAAKAAGYKKALIVETDGETLVVTKRTDLDLDDPTNPARKAAFYDNRTSEFVDYDAELVLEALQEQDLSQLWDQSEMDALLATAPTARQFAPVLTPPMNHTAVTEEDVNKTAAKMSTRFESQPGDAVEIICPHCGEAFYVDKV